TALIVAASVVAVAVVAILLANLADSGSGTKATKKKSSTSTPAATSTALRLRIGAVHTQNTGLPTKVKPPVRVALVKIAQGYVHEAGQSADGPRHTHHPAPHRAHVRERVRSVVRHGVSSNRAPLPWHHDVELRVHFQPERNHDVNPKGRFRLIARWRAAGRVR